MVKTILLVEDNDMIRKLYRIILEKEGYEVVEAKDGEECLKSVDESEPDLIVLDLMMPVMDGWEVLEALREGTRTKDIPVIMVSLTGGREHVKKAIGLGAREFLLKDGDMPHILIERIGSILE